LAKDDRALDSPDFIVGLEEICKYCGFGKDSFWELVKIYKMPFAKIGNKIIADKKILNEFMRTLILKSPRDPSDFPPQ
jgi:predicted DNA-binding transcriptional regulator AlpA